MTMGGGGGFGMIGTPMPGGPIIGLAGGKIGTPVSTTGSLIGGTEAMPAGSGARHTPRGAAGL